MADSTSARIQKRPRFSLGLILNVYSVVLAVLPIAIVIAIASNLFERQAKEQAVNQMEVLAEAQTQEISRWLQNSSITLKLILTNPGQYRSMEEILLTLGFIGPKGVRVTNFLQEQLALQDSFDELFLYNLDGDIRLSTAADQVGVNVKNQGQPYFEAGLTGIYLQPPYFDATRGTFQSVVLQPIYDSSDHLVGLLAGRLSLTDLSRIMARQVGLGETGESYLISRSESSFVTPSRFESYSPTQAIHSSGIDQALSEVEGTGFYSNYRGRAVIGVYRWLPELDSGMLAEIEVAEALRTVAVVQNLSGLVALVAVVLAVLIGLSVTGWLTRSITGLTDTAIRVSEGDLTTRAPIRSQNELGLLAVTFNSMVDQLHQTLLELETQNAQTTELNKALQHAKDELERRVQERTLALAQSNDQLRQEIAERKLTEIELKKAKDIAEEANQLKSHFLANMSHELRTPLNAIINFAYLLNLGAEGEITPGQANLLERIEDAGRHLLGLINDVLDLAKLEAGRLELALEPVDMHPVIAGVLSTARALVGNKPIELREDVSDNLPLVRADPTRVRQVLLNLLSNAAKFTDGGYIVVRAVPDGDWVCFSVQDTGIGISPDDLPKTFMEFVQLDGSLNRQANGTGLGLPISKRFVEMHGGSMWAESQPGVGSTFFFTLPRVPETEVVANA